jgi:hypothetical protein
MIFTPGITGLLVIDPYNDFISEGGKVWDRLKGVAEANGCIPHNQRLLPYVVLAAWLVVTLTALIIFSRKLGRSPAQA